MISSGTSLKSFSSVKFYPERDKIINGILSDGIHSNRLKTLFYSLSETLSSVNGTYMNLNTPETLDFSHLDSKWIELNIHDQTGEYSLRFKRTQMIRNATKSKIENKKKKNLLSRPYRCYDMKIKFISMLEFINFLEFFSFFKAKILKETKLKSIFQIYGFHDPSDMNKYDVDRVTDKENYGINFRTFLCLLYEISINSGGNNNDQKKNMKNFKKILTLIYTSNEYSHYNFENMLCLIKWNDSKVIERAFFLHQASIVRLFTSYSKKYQTWGVELDEARRKLKKSDHISRFMKFEDLRIFCHEFGILSDINDNYLVSRTDLKNIFQNLEKVKFKKRSKNKQQTILRTRTPKLIDFNGFRDFLLRVSIFKYKKSSSFFNTSTTKAKTNLKQRSFDDRDYVEVLNCLFNSFSDKYNEKYSIRMESEILQCNDLKIPFITSVTPQELSFSEDNEPSNDLKKMVKVKGVNFNELQGGIYLKIDLSGQKRIIRYLAMSVEKSARDVHQVVQFLFPNITFKEIESDNENLKLDIQISEISKMKYSVNIKFILNTFLEASNNFSNFQPKSSNKKGIAHFYYFKNICNFDLGHEITYGILSFFSDFDQVNMKSWSKFKEFFRVLFPNLLIQESNGQINKYEEKILSEEIGGLDNFLKLLIYFACVEISNVHPLDFLISIIQKNIEITELNNLVIDLNDVIFEESEEYNFSINFRNFKSISDLEKVIDVYAGPLLLGRIVLDKISNHCLDKFEYNKFSNVYEQTLSRIIEFSETYQHLIGNLLNSGFDIAAPTRDVNTRNPIGRAYTIHYTMSKGEKDKIGCVWDYPGCVSYFCLPIFHKALDIKSECFSIAIYKKNEIMHFADCFRRAKTFSQLKNDIFYLKNKKYTLRLKVY